MLASALRKHLNDDERSALLNQLVLINNASLDLVNTIISSIHSNDDDSIILVLGALARNTDLVTQKVIVDELLKRLNTVLSSSNNEALSTLIYALGNSGSKLAISTLLSALQISDIDIQISAIRSLASHLDQPVVQQAIITLLPLTDEDKILEEVLKILIDAYENKVLINPSEELIGTVVKCAVQLDNPNLYEPAVKYLESLKIDWAEIYLNLLKQQHNYGDLQHIIISDMNKNDSRTKRGLDWDENNSDYNMVASYSDRRSDVTNFPKHKAYIWGDTFGISNLNMKVGVGGFAGIGLSSSNMNYKLYARGAADIHVFGRNYDIVDFEISRSAIGNYVHDKIYVAQASYLNSNTKTKVKPKCVKTSSGISGSAQIMNTDISIYVFVGYISTDISGRVSFGLSWGLCACLSLPPLSEPSTTCNANLKLSFRMGVSGDTSTTLLVRMQLSVCF